MVKDQITITLDREVLKKVEKVMEEEYPGASRSYVIESLVRNALVDKRIKGDVPSVTK